MERTQLNLRVSDDLSKAVDEKRVALMPELGYIPSRSDILRMALERFLELDLSKSEVDQRRSEAKNVRTGNTAPSGRRKGS